MLGLGCSETLSPDAAAKVLKFFRDSVASVLGAGDEATLAAALTAAGADTAPKVPKKNFRRMMENDRKILRFMARLDTDAPEDQGRIFVIKYFMADDTVAAFEPPQKNSGIMGGKFIQRGRVKKPNSHEYYTQADFYTGARIEFNKFGFVLYQADEYSLSYMESDPESHPMSDIHYIAEQLRPVLKAPHLPPPTAAAAHGQSAQQSGKSIAFQ